VVEAKSLQNEVEGLKTANSGLQEHAEALLRRFDNLEHCAKQLQDENQQLVLQVGTPACHARQPQRVTTAKASRKPPQCADGTFTYTRMDKSAPASSRQPL
jgi:hypothetical protein